MSIKVIKGNILDPSYTITTDVIVHGCNCFHTMGGGIANQIKRLYNEAFQVDVFETQYGSQDKLGTISFTKHTTPIIVNTYTQYGMSADYQQADYNAIRSTLKLVKAQFTRKKISMPLIGAGLAGGNWETILSIIIDELSDEDITIVVYQDELNADDIVTKSLEQIMDPTSKTINFLSSPTCVSQTIIGKSKIF